MKPQNKSDDELLELFLSLSRNQQDVKKNAPILLKLINEILARQTKEKIISKPVINSWKHLLNYCQITMTNLKEEQFRILFLDKKHYLIRDELIQNGRVENVEINIPKIIEQTLNCFANSIVLLHNHPNNSAQPSKMDIKTTKKIINTLKTASIKICDHLIIGKNGEIFSFKNEGLL